MQKLKNSIDNYLSYSYNEAGSKGDVSLSIKKQVFEGGFLL